MTYSDGDEVRFGKHKGETIDAIIADDPGWVRWAVDNIKDFDLDEEMEAMLEVSERMR